MKITYTGPFAQLEIGLDDGKRVVAKQGQAVEVPDQVGAELVARDDFKGAPASPSPGGEGRGEGGSKTHLKNSQLN